MTRLLFVTGHVPPDRVPAFAALHERVPGLRVALFGGRIHHATAGVADPGVPFTATSQRGVHALAASGRYDVVVCGTAGRTALPAAFLGAGRAGARFVLWSAFWGWLRTPAHVAARPFLRRVHREADAVAGYGTHVTDFARSLGARRTTIAPQSVDGAFWGARADVPPPPRPVVVFAGRDAPGKGADVLRAAWPHVRADADLVLAGVPPRGAVGPVELRNMYAAASVVVVPSVPTRDFLEPWGLVCNEAMHQGTPIIATDAVGAAAGGLVRHGRNGLVVPHSDPGALASAIDDLLGDDGLRTRLGAAAREDVAPFTPEAWAAGITEAVERPQLPS